MLSLFKAKKKRKSMAPYILENLTAVMTLSDRLRQAGIREFEPDDDTKISKNRKYNNERKKKLQNLSTDFYSSYFKETYQDEACHGKTLSKNYKGFSRTLRRRIRGSAKKTLSASLDFINDCQKYKKKVRTPKSHSLLKSQQKNAGVSSDFKQPLNMKEEPLKLQYDRNDCQMLGYNIKKVDSVTLNFSEEEKSENSCKREDSPFNEETSENVRENNATINVVIKKLPERKPAETFSYVEPFIDKLPSGDVARIDKKYLESLLSLANRQSNEKNIKEDETKKSAEPTGERKKKKKTDKVFSENNTIVNEAEVTATEMQKDSRGKSVTLYQDLVPVRVLRDSTKSEVQILPQTEKNLSNQRNSEMKSEKNVTQNKPEDDTRKRRKTRNKLLKSKIGELSNLTSPDEVSKVADLKELWRRETREKSENSLSSNSSCTVPENEQVSERKNLGIEAYNVLHKIVLEEVRKISKKPENTDNLGQIKNENKPKTNDSTGVKPAKESGKGENICKLLNISLTEISNKVSDKTKNEVGAHKKKLMQAENQQRYSTYEGEKQNVQLLNLLVDDNLKDQKAKLKLIREKEEKIGKTASQIVQNWSILNRLEQAFVALGTPDFQNKNLKGPKALKNENLTSNEKITTGNTYIGKIEEEHIQKVNKIPPKSKEAAEKKNYGDSVNASDANTKALMQSSHNKKPENDKKRNLLKENQQGNKIRKEIKNEGSQNGSLLPMVSGGKENKTKKENNTNQKKNKISNETTHGPPPKKPTTLRTIANNELNENDFRNSRKKAQDLKPPIRGRPSAPAKNRYQKKSYTNLELNNSSGTALERKRTFDVIPNKDISKAQKSEGDIKTDENFEWDSSTKHLSQNKNDIKSNTFVDKNVKSEVTSDRKSRENDSGSKRKPIISRNSARTPNKEQPTNSNEKEFLKRSRESSVKTSRGKNNQEKNCERAEPMEALPQQILAKKELNSNERATKERSILSIRGNQKNTEESTKKMMEIEEKSTFDFYSTLKSTTGNLVMRKAQKDLDDLLEKSAQLAQSDFSRMSYGSTSNYRLLEVCSIDKQNEVVVDNQKDDKWNFSRKLTPLFGYNNGLVTPAQQNVEINKELKFPKYQPLWEQDIRHYHAIVKDIMSQYKRLNGFLKQSDQPENFPNDSVNLVSTNNPINIEKTDIANNCTKTDLREYRKKIISEYQALPIFEYKSKLQQMEGENLKEAKKRNLLVVKDIKADMDLDVKDFQPNIQKVLDSQLYVDIESLVKRNHPNVKFNEKKSSLQEIVLGKNEKMYSQEECPRSNSTPKTFLLLPNSKSTQKLKTVENYQEDSYSAITSVSCLEETESEIL